MTIAEPIASLTITVFARHSVDCPKRDDPQWKRCKCNKSIYIRERGKTRYISAKTRSWAEAEELAQAERDKRNPVKIELQKIAESEAIKHAARLSKLKPLGEALDQWLIGMKSPGKTSVNAYRSTTRKILRWAARVGVENVSDVTPALLDEWRSSWTSALTTQAALLTRVKAFFRWATAMEFTERNPTLMLKPVTPEESQTWPVTPAQFDELLAATYKFDEDARYESAKVGKHLRAIFLVQRWTGLRVGDVLALPKSALRGNRLAAVIQKKVNRKPGAARVECILPDHVVEALASLPNRNHSGGFFWYEHPDYFFWSKACTQQANTNKWLRKVDRLNDYLSFKDEAGKPMGFRTHMLRDMFAVEMLLAGVTLEKVSKLLTHESVKMTERYYAKWTASRKQQLEDETIAAMRRMGVKVGGD
jgi:site-specific recombinase XerD